MAVKTTQVGAGTLVIGADLETVNLSSQVTACRLVTSADQSDSVYVLSGESVAGDRTETQTLEVTLFQDFGNLDSTTEWLYEHAGETHSFEFVPNSAKGKAITGSLIVEATDIGGDVKTNATSDVTFNVVGKAAITTVV